jgi:hypothetical protein
MLKFLSTFALSYCGTDWASPQNEPQAARPKHGIYQGKEKKDISMPVAPAKKVAPNCTQCRKPNIHNRAIRPIGTPRIPRIIAFPII